MASVHDVAAYILEKKGEITTWKLQKLVYYSQAWNLVWNDETLFDDRIEAWANGPVVRALYRKHRREFTVGAWPIGNSGGLDRHELGTIDAVIESYGGLTGRQLSHLTHSEAPWLEAREGLGPTEPATTAISLATMQSFYGALDVADDAQPVEEIDWSVIGD